MIMNFANLKERPAVRQTVSFGRVNNAKPDRHLEQLLAAADAGGEGVNLANMSPAEIQKRLLSN